MRKSLKDQENSSPDAIFTNPTHDATPTHIPPPLAPPPIHEVLRLETCHPVPSLLSEVACVRYMYMYCTCMYMYIVCSNIICINYGILYLAN